MAGNNFPLFVAAPKFGSVTMVAADAQTVKTLYTPGGNGSRVQKLILQSNDTSARDVGIYINGVLVSSVSVPIGAGQTSGAPAVDALASSTCKIGYFDPFGNYVVDLPATSGVLGVAALTTVTAAKTITAACVCGDF